MRRRHCRRLEASAAVVVYLYRGSRVAPNEFRQICKSQDEGRPNKERDLSSRCVPILD